jgi:hypothetical protein
MKIKTSIVTIFFVISILSGCVYQENVSIVIDQINPDYFAPLWYYSSDNIIVSTPIIIGNKLIIRTTKQLIAMDKNLGEIIWTYEINSPLENHEPVTDGDILIVSDQYDNIIAININNGELIWADDLCDRSILEHHCYCLDDVMIDEEFVFVSRLNNFLIAYDKNDGKIAWRNRGENRCILKMTIYENFLFYSCVDKLVIMDKNTGVNIREFYLSSNIIDMAIVDDNLWVLHSNDSNYLKESTLESYQIPEINLLWEKRYTDFIADTICENYFLSGEGYIEVDFEGELIRESPFTDLVFCPIRFGDFIITRKNEDDYFIQSLVDDQVTSLGFKDKSYYKRIQINPVIDSDILYIPMGVKSIIVLSIKQ